MAQVFTCWRRSAPVAIRVPRYLFTFKIQSRNFTVMKKFICILFVVVILECRVHKLGFQVFVEAP